MRTIVGLLFIYVILGSGYTVYAQDTVVADYKTEIEKYRKGINIKLVYDERSPLTIDQKKDFNGLNYFPVKYDYLVKAKLVKEPVQEKLILKTTTDREPEYIKYGKVFFKIDTFNLTLTVYRNPPEKQIAKEDRTLFVPFKDETSGKECYGGGRYIEFELPEEGDSVYLDFNKAYNPYCAYNHRYSCVIPPPENWLPVRIEAGEKKFEE